MLSEQFCRLRPTSSRGWSWHSVPASKRRGAFSPIPSRNFWKISGQPSLLKHQRKSNKMVSFRDYEMNLLFLLLVKFHGSGNCEIFSPTQRILQCFLPCAIFKLRHQRRRPFIFERDVCQNDFRTPRWLSAVFIFQI